MRYRDARDAFEDAIQNDVLSDDREYPNYAGYYMYMGTSEKGDKFKHKGDRTYVYSQTGSLK